MDVYFLQLAVRFGHRATTARLLSAPVVLAGGPPNKSFLEGLIMASCLGLGFRFVEQGEACAKEWGFGDLPDKFFAIRHIGVSHLEVGLR